MTESNPVRVFTDGCCKGNPGPTGAGFVIEDEATGDVIEEGCRPLGTGTNNEAEYQALILAMERCIELGLTRAHFHTDSQLMERQLNGIYKIKEPRMAQFARRVQELKKAFDRFQITSIRREFNKRADELANLGLKTQDDSRIDAD